MITKQIIMNQTTRIRLINTARRNFLLAFSLARHFLLMRYRHIPKASPLLDSTRTTCETAALRRLTFFVRPKYLNVDG